MALTQAPGPLPPLGWLFLSGLAGIIAIGRRRRGVTAL
jgi:MYXO-CTERM domain-containing protein